MMKSLICLLLSALMVACMAADGPFLFIQERTGAPSIPHRVSPTTGAVPFITTGNVMSTTPSVSFGRALLNIGTAAAARSAVLPTFTGQSGKYLKVNSAETDVEYSTVASAASADTLTGTTLAANVTVSSLLSAAGGTFGSAAFVNTAAFEVPLSAGTGLTRTSNTLSVNATQAITSLSNLTTNGFVKTSGGDGTLSVDTGTYLLSSTAASTYATISNLALKAPLSAPEFTGQIITDANIAGRSAGVIRYSDGQLRFDGGLNDGIWHGGIGGNIFLQGADAVSQNGGNGGSLLMYGQLGQNAGSINTLAGGSLTMGTGNLAGGDVSGTILTTTGDGSGLTGLTNLNASNLTDGTVPTARLGTTGTANNTTYLRGDQTWAAAAGLGTNTFTGAQTISDTTASTSKTTGALTVAGGLGVSGSIFASQIRNGGFDSAIINISGYLPYASAFASFAGEFAAIGINIGPSNESGFIANTAPGTNRGYHFADSAGWGTVATSLLCDATNVMAVRRGTNPQHFRIYETDASGTNDEYIEIGAAADVNYIKPVATGAGVLSTLRHFTTDTVWLGSRSGTPEGTETAGIGSTCTDTATGITYYKTSGTGNTGWTTVTNAMLAGGIDLTTKVTDVLPVANGGSGVASHTSYALLAGGTTGTGVVQSLAGVGTPGQVLTSNGADALPTFQTASSGGKVLQMVYATKTDATTGTSTTPATVFSATITPTSATSRIVATFTGSGSVTNGWVGYVEIARGSTGINIADAAGSRIATGMAYGHPTQASYGLVPLALTVVDSPATTSATTYNVRFSTEAGGVYYINRSALDVGTSAYSRTASTLVLMEVAP